MPGIRVNSGLKFRRYTGEEDEMEDTISGLGLIVVLRRIHGIYGNTTHLHDQGTLPFKVWNEL